MLKTRYFDQIDKAVNLLFDHYHGNKTVITKNPDTGKFEECYKTFNRCGYEYTYDENGSVNIVSYILTSVFHDAVCYVTTKLETTFKLSAFPNSTEVHNGYIRLEWEREGSKSSKLPEYDAVSVGFEEGDGLLTYGEKIILVYIRAVIKLSQV